MFEWCGYIEITENIDLFIFFYRLIAFPFLPLKPAYFLLVGLPGDLANSLSYFFAFLLLLESMLRRVKLENPCLFLFFEAVALSFLLMTWNVFE